MNKVRQLISFIAFLGFIGAVGWGIYKLVVYIWSSTSEIDPTIAAAIIAGCSTVIISIAGILVQKSKEQRINIQVEHRNKVAPIYEEFIDNIFSKLLFADNLGNERLSQQELVKVVAGFTQKILIWGSNDVINAYNNFRKESNLKSDNPSVNTLFTIEELLLAIRKDLGHPTKGFRRGQLLRLFVNDLDKFMK